MNLSAVCHSGSQSISLLPREPRWSSEFDYFSYSQLLTDIIPLPRPLTFAPNRSWQSNKRVTVCPPLSVRGGCAFLPTVADQRGASPSSEHTPLPLFHPIILFLSSHCCVDPLELQGCYLYPPIVLACLQFNSNNQRANFNSLSEVIPWLKLNFRSPHDETIGQPSSLSGYNATLRFALLPHVHQFNVAMGGGVWKVRIMVVHFFPIESAFHGNILLRIEVRCRPNHCDSCNGKRYCRILSEVNFCHPRMSLCELHKSLKEPQPERSDGTSCVKNQCLPWYYGHVSWAQGSNVRRAHFCLP
ncbi:hypothetical protein K438DRAFT_447567 [Mycena galopus ATCC 62051]|nr:hypothetical protein K438DRAFT_447567 [Mycena galopus ATCC 62051]